MRRPGAQAVVRNLAEDLIGIRRPSKNTRLCSWPLPLKPLSQMRSEELQEGSRETPVVQMSVQKLLGMPGSGTLPASLCVRARGAWGAARPPERCVTRSPPSRARPSGRVPEMRRSIITRSPWCSISDIAPALAQPALLFHHKDMKPSPPNRSKYLAFPTTSSPFLPLPSKPSLCTAVSVSAPYHRSCPNPPASTEARTCRPNDLHCSNESNALHSTCSHCVSHFMSSAVGS